MSSNHLHMGRLKLTKEYKKTYFDKPPDIRKCVHFRLYPGSKLELDILGARLRLKRQEIMEALVEAALAEDNNIIQILVDYRKKLENIKGDEIFLKDTDADTLMQIIADQNPFNNK